MNFFCGVTYAEETPIASQTTTAPRGTDEPPEYSTSKATASGTSTSGSGISLGGYDPVIMSNGLFQLLQEKQVFDSNDAFAVKNAVENSQGGVSFGGVNVAAFCEVILNKLIAKRILSLDRAKEMVAKSQKAGGDFNWRSEYHCFASRSDELFA